MRDELEKKFSARESLQTEKSRVNIVTVTLKKVDGIEDIENTKMRIYTWPGIGRVYNI